MKKKGFLLLFVPVLCLMSCNKNATPTYRDNAIKSERYLDGTLTDVVTIEYDENGLPIEENITSHYEEQGIKAKNEYRHTFDDKHREIKLEKIATTMPEDSKNSAGINPKKQITITTRTREYDGDFLSKETTDEQEYYDNELRTRITTLMYRHIAENKSGYSVFSVLSRCMTSGSDINSLLQFTANFYDKQKRDVGSLTFEIKESRVTLNNNDRYAYIGIALNFKFTSINYESDSNNSNDYYKYSLSQNRKGYSNFCDSSMSRPSRLSQRLIVGHETYSDKNLLVSRQETITGNLISSPLVSNTLEREYDDLDRLIHEEESSISYDGSGEVEGTNTSIIDYTYVDNNKKPSKVITNTEVENKVMASKTKTKTVEDTTFDEYGRILSASSEKEKTVDDGVTTKSSERINNEYGDPIIIPEGEILIH